MTRKPGRPPRSGTTATELVRLRVTTAELREWKRLARLGKTTLSEWLRSLANRHADFQS